MRGDDWHREPPTSEHIVNEKSQSSPKAADGKGQSALEREADHIDKLMHDDHSGRHSSEGSEAAGGLNNPVQVEQDNRVEKAKADAKAAGGGSGEPEDGLNQDG